jgi:hypothetical protein
METSHIYVNPLIFTHISKSSQLPSGTFTYPCVPHLAPRLQDAAEAFVALPGRGQKQRRGTVFGSQIHGGFLLKKSEFSSKTGKEKWYFNGILMG